MPALSTFGNMSARPYGLSQGVERESFETNWVDKGVGWWVSAAVSRDGSTMMAGTINSNLYRSLDGGETFEATTLPKANWMISAISNDGSIMMTANENGQLRISRDYGATWATALTNGTFTYGLAISKDKQVFVVTQASKIYVSANSGSTWKGFGTTKSWRHCAANQDGTFIAVAALNDIIYVSNNLGQTFTPSGSGSKAWNGIACSDDASIIAATCETTIASGGGLWVSRDLGVTWANILKANNLTSVCMTGDAERIVACDTAGNFYYFSKNLSLLKTDRIITGQPRHNRAAVGISDDAKTLIGCSSSSATNGTLGVSKID